MRRTRPALALVPFLVLLAGCPTPPEPTEEPTPDEPVVDPIRRTVEGTVTWSTVWDPEYAEDADYAQDCTITRTYVGYETQSVPWMCADCLDLYELEYDAAQDTGDCSDTAFHSLGFGGTRVRMAPQEDFILFDASELTYLDYLNEGVPLLGGPIGEGTVDDEQIRVDYVETGWAWTTDWSFSLQRGTDDGDVFRGMVPPDEYRCGWTRTDAAPYEGDYRAVVGAQLPDGVLVDQCAEPVRLRDLLGPYLVIESGGIGCGPCERAAEDAPGLLAELAAEGIDAEYITTLLPYNWATEVPIGPSVTAAWAGAHGLEGPVLLDPDRWFDTILERGGSDPFGIPAYMLVGPDGSILYVQGDEDIDLAGVVDLVRADAAR